MRPTLVSMCRTSAAVAGLFCCCIMEDGPGIGGNEGFVTTEGTQFVLNGAPHYFVGANFWQGMGMGMATLGDRAKLARELDRMKTIGITNLRVMASSEGPGTNADRMSPTLQPSPGVYDPDVWDGLDYLISEMNDRKMHAVMVINNFWDWSGGMVQYLEWYHDSIGDGIEYPTPQSKWFEFLYYMSDYYACDECDEWFVEANVDTSKFHKNPCAMCNDWFESFIDTLLNHYNPYTGRRYRDEPTVFAWQLANEPRYAPPAWIDKIAAYIKTIDPNHMVTTGSEGKVAVPNWSMDEVKDLHDGSDIDYMTVHLWPQNWGWHDPAKGDMDTTAMENAISYIDEHEKTAVAINKPLVLEEFGLARDDGKLSEGTPTKNRREFYSLVFDEVYRSASEGGPLAGDNFWVWGGESRSGDIWEGDPPHEESGWYAVYDTDTATHAIIAAHAANMASLTAGE